MARQGKTLPARRPTIVDDSLLIRSAESLGRVIGSLQRQLDAARLLTHRATSPVSGNGSAPPKQRTAGATMEKTKKKSSGGTKASAQADRSSKRAAKSAAAKKTGSRHRSGAKRRAAKTSRRT